MLAKYAFVLVSLLDITILGQTTSLENQLPIEATPSAVIVPRVVAAQQEPSENAEEAIPIDSNSSADGQPIIEPSDESVSTAEVINPSEEPVVQLPVAIEAEALVTNPSEESVPSLGELAISTTQFSEDSVSEMQESAAPNQTTDLEQVAEETVTTIDESAVPPVIPRNIPQTATLSQMSEFLEETNVPGSSESSTTGELSDDQEELTDPVQDPGNSDEPVVQPRVNVTSEEPAVQPQATVTSEEPAVQPRVNVTSEEPAVQPQATVASEEPAVQPPVTVAIEEPAVQPQRPVEPVTPIQVSNPREEPRLLPETNTPDEPAAPIQQTNSQTASNVQQQTSNDPSIAQSSNENSNSQTSNDGASQPNVEPQRILQLSDLNGVNVKAEVPNQNEEPLNNDLETPQLPEIKDTNPQKSTPFNGVTPGTEKSKGESNDDPVASSSVDIGVIVGISVAVVVACVLGYVLMNRNREQRRDVETPVTSIYSNATSEDSQNMFATLPADKKIHNTTVANYFGSTSRTSFASSNNAPYVNHSQVMGYFEAPPSSHSHQEYDSGELDVETEHDYISAEEVNTQHGQNNLSIYTNDDLPPMTTYSMFLQESSQVNDQDMVSDDGFSSIRESFGNKEAHFSLGTIGSDFIQETDSSPDAYPMPVSSIITAMNNSYIHNQDSPLPAHIVTEQARRAASTDSINSFESMF